MNCQRALDNLSSYVDGELPESERRDMELHLCDCANCQAQLRSIERLSQTFQAASVWESARPAIGAWEQLTSRMDEQLIAEPMVAIETATTSAKSTGRSSNATWFGWALAVAAAVLLYATWHSVETQPKTGEIAVDFSEEVQRFAQQPELAMESLSKKYAGEEVEVQQAEKMLGYRPAVARHLPSNVRLVSTRLLKLPECICANGKCMCKINGCNCSASLCERADGSEFLVLEHCDSERVGFKDVASQDVVRGNHELRVLGDGEPHVASWTIDQHRITAIGLNGTAEALALADAIEVPSHVSATESAQ